MRKVIIMIEEDFDELKREYNNAQATIVELQKSYKELRTVNELLHTENRNLYEQREIYEKLLLWFADNAE
jgi:uncharacterized coiled-coil DUF342 family protein